MSERVPVKKFSWAALDASLAFDQLKEYFVIMEEGGRAIEKRYQKKIDSHVDAIADYEERQITGQSLYQQHYFRFQDNLPKQISLSYIALLYALIENQFRALSDFISEERISSVSIFDFDGDLSEKVRRYQRVNPKLRIPDSELRTVKEISKVRNCIVHNYGVIKKEEAGLLRYCLANKFIAVQKTNSGGEIEKVDMKWCHDLTEMAHDMFNNVYDSLGYMKTIDFSGLKKKIKKN
jgi:hypothetical protein